MRLDSFCQNHLRLKTKIGLLTLQNVSFSRLTNKLVVLFEYLQLLSQAILLDPRIYNFTETAFADRDLLFKVAVYFCKLVNPAYLLDFTPENNGLVIRILVLIICFMVFRYLIFAKIVMSSHRNSEENRIVLLIWRCLFKLQGRVTCYLITSFWMRTILTISDHSFSINGIASGPIIGLASFLFATEYLFSFFLETQFFDFLPNENFFFAGKTYKVQIITLSQKLILQVIQIVFRDYPTANSWVFRITSLGFCIIRDSKFFKRLPFYNIKALFYQGCLLGPVTVLNILCFLQVCLSSGDYFSKQDEIHFLVIGGILFSLLAAKIYHSWLEYLIVRLATQKSKNEAEMISNKFNVRAYLGKQAYLPGKKTKEYEWGYLLKCTQKMNMKNIYSLDDQELNRLKLNINNPSMLNKLSVKYLEKITNRHPNKLFLKLYLASLCAQDSDLYAQGIKILAELSKNPWSKYYLSSAFLLHQIQTAIVQDSNTSGLNLDLYTFIKSRISVEEVAMKMSQQAESKIKVCQEMLQDSCEIAKIHESAQSISKFKQEIQREINQILKNAPEYYIQPLLLFAEYSLVLNYSPKECKKFQNLYTKRYNKYEKHFISPKFTEEILYQNNNIFLLVSGEKVNNGLIQYCTKSIQNLCGRPQVSYKSLHVSSLFITGLQNLYISSFKDERFLNKIVRSYFAHNDGYITEADFYLRVHPYITQNLYLCMIIRPVVSQGNFLILSEDGMIEGVSKHLLKVLDPISRNIKEISSELTRANQAFNIIQKLQKQFNVINPQDLPSRLENFHSMSSEGMRYATALQLYSTYFFQGKKINLFTKQPITKRSSLMSDHFTTSFYCTISFLPDQSAGLKLVKLESASRDLTKDEQTLISIDKIQKGATENTFFEEDIVTPSPKIHKNRIPTFGPQSENFDNCEENAEVPSPMLWDFKSPISTERYLFTGHSQRVLTFVTPNLPKSNEVLSSMATQENNQNVPPPAATRIPGYAASNNSSTGSFSDGTNRVFKKALLVHSYPTTFHVFCKVFYLVILATFCSQIVLKFAADSTMNDLVLKKDMLAYTQLRAFWDIKTQILARGGALQISGNLTAGDLDSVSNSVKGVITDMLEYTRYLDNANTGLLSGIDSLDDSLKKKIFKSDIRLVGSIDDSSAPSFNKITNFQAVAQMINAAKKADSLKNPISSEGYNILTYVTYNTLNDFLAKNKQITEIFIESISDQRESFEEAIVLCLLVTPILLAVMALVLTFIIFNQYRMEKHYMETFLKLHPKGIKIALNSFFDFKRRIDNEDWQQDNSQSDLSDLFSVAIQNLQIKQYHKKENDQLIKYSQTQKRYYKYVLRILFYSILLLGIMAWNYITSTHSKDTIYKMHEQIQFANSLSEKVVTTYVSFVELFASNNTNYIAHNLPETELINSIKNLQDIQSQLLDVFSNSDNENNAQVKAVLYDDGGCEKLNLVTSQAYCTTMINTGKLTAIAPALAYFEGLMQGKFKAYQDVKLSSMANIFATALTNIDQSVMASAVIASKAQLITTILSENLSDQISNFYHQRTLIIIIFLITLSLAGFLFWFEILVKIREVNNDFKRVLQIFPADFVLSSFLLKKFIKETTKGFYRL